MVLLIAQPITDTLLVILIWGVVPAVVGLILFGLSIRSLVLNFSVAQAVLRLLDAILRTEPCPFRP
jgi:hypothetical protein